MSEFNTTALRADNNPAFYARFKWLGLGALLFTAYCLYDGYVNWPDQQNRAVALLKLAEEKLPSDVLEEAVYSGHDEHERYRKVALALKKDEAAREAWEDLAAIKKWPKAPPEKLRTDGDVVGQYVMAGLALITGVWMLLSVLLAGRRWIELREGVVHTSWGQSFPLSAVTKIDKRPWRDKGIARVHYLHEGRKGRFAVDNYKYERKATDELLRRIEAAVGVDKITGGPPESAPEVAAPAPVG